jgi:hypothetical protein
VCVCVHYIYIYIERERERVVSSNTGVRGSGNSISGRTVLHKLLMRKISLRELWVFRGPSPCTICLKYILTFLNTRFTPLTGLALVSDAVNFHIRWVIDHPCVFKSFSVWQISAYILHYFKTHGVLLFNMCFVWAVMLQSFSHSKKCEGERLCYWCLICLPFTCKLFEIMIKMPICYINNTTNTNFFMQ